MKLTISIDEDKELRAQIKAMVKEQLVGITRSAVDEAVGKEVSRKLDQFTASRLDSIVFETARKVIRDTLCATNFSGSGATYVDHVVNVQSQAIIEQAAKEAIAMGRLDSKIIKEAARLLLHEATRS